MIENKKFPLEKETGTIEDAMLVAYQKLLEVAMSFNRMMKKSSFLSGGHILNKLLSNKLLFYPTDSQLDEVLKI